MTTRTSPVHHHPTTLAGQADHADPTAGGHASRVTVGHTSQAAPTHTDPAQPQREAHGRGEASGGVGSQQWGIGTILAHAGTGTDPTTGAITTPIHLSTAYAHPGLGASTGYDYTRTANPTRDVLQDTLAQLDGATASFATSSGMAAIALTIEALVPAGGHIIALEDLYGGSFRYLSVLAEQGTYDVTFIRGQEELLAATAQAGTSESEQDAGAGGTHAGTDAGHVTEDREAHGPATSNSDADKTDGSGTGESGTGGHAGTASKGESDGRDVHATAGPREPRTLVLVESPTNPMMDVLDIPAVARAAHAAGALLAVDNTFYGPTITRPLAKGADVALYSATKYLGGHNDVCAGVVSVADEHLAQRLQYRLNTTGATLDPLSSFLLLRGLKTLALRMERHEANARAVAAALEADPRVTRVLYPGRSGMVSFELAPGADVGRFLAAVRVFTFAESLGGVESLVTCPAVQTHADVPREVRESYGLTDQLLRLSVGIEDAEDLIADLHRALEACDG